jgi:hypothetical protein
LIRLQLLIVGRLTAHFKDKLSMDSKKTEFSDLMKQVRNFVINRASRLNC